MNMLRGEPSLRRITKTSAKAGAKADGVKARIRAGAAGRLEAAPVPEPSFPERPPRIDGGSSEIVTLDGDGRILVVNQAWREAIAAYGVVPWDAGVGAPYVDVVCRYMPEIDRATLELSVRRLLSGETDQVRQTYAIRTADGLRWRHVQITPLSVGTASRFVAIHDDQTELAITQKALRTTSEQLLTARDEERQRIAVELHDSTSQHLVAISFALTRLRQVSPEGGPERAILNDMAKSLKEALKETRVLSYLMEPRALGRDGLPAALVQFLDGFTKRTGLKVALEADEAISGIPVALQHAALRIVQEALLNAHRHAQARNVSVALRAGDGQLTVSVADDGRGMNTDRGEPCLGVGIPGMHARAQQFSGHLAISSDEAGTRVVATLPLA